MSETPTFTAADFNQAVDTARAILARQLDKSLGVEPLAQRLDANCEGYSAVTVFGAVVSLLHKSAAILVELGTNGITRQLPPLQRRAIAEAAVRSLIFGALTTMAIEPIEDGATVAGPETAQ